MAKTEAILKIEPETELRFRGPFKEPVSVVMKLSNRTDRKVCFKVKTTAPKRYCVKPTTGVIDPKGLVTILVTLQPFDPNDPNEKGKHKFQVLSVYAPETEFNIETLWKEASGETIHDWKLKCVLEMPEEGAAQVPSTTAPVAEAATAPAVAVAAAVNPVAAVPAKREEPVKDSSAAKLSGLENEVRKASEEINHLREEISSVTKENIQLKEEGLRLRRSAATAAAPPKVEQPPMPRPPSYDLGSSVSTSSSNLMYIFIALLIGIIIGKIFF